MKNLIWFRSDLRTLDNPALYAAMHHNPVQEVCAVFLICEHQWLEHDWGANKIGFVLQNVLALQQELTKLNINLEIIAADYFKNIPKQLLNYAQDNKCNNVFYNIEYELNEQQRDASTTSLLKQNAITCHTFHDQCLIPPGVILNKQNAPYNVFTPFKKSCYVYLADHPIKLQPQITSQTKAAIKVAQIPQQHQQYLDSPILKLWPAGQKAADKKLQEFCNNSLLDYQQQRDFPALEATSSLSAYLAVGAISVRQCFLAAIAQNKHEFASGKAGVTCWISELIWRDFYRNIIWHFPNICKGENFNHKYDKLHWEYSAQHLQAWQQGRTGIPIIDAAMRQLVATGWMHNRLRMVVAMFLTKNLLIDWREGEKFFAQHLFDLDFASNNGGWQWSASTGTDAVPYFRIFNPVTQSSKFDPNGTFIKKYCPELKGLNAKQIHDPSAFLDAQQLEKLNYPVVIVDISKSRIRALERFKGL